MPSPFTSLSHHLVQIFRTFHSTPPPQPPTIPLPWMPSGFCSSTVPSYRWAPSFSSPLFIFLQFSFHFTADPNSSLQRRTQELTRQPGYPLFLPLSPELHAPPYPPRTWSDQDRILLRKQSEEERNRQGPRLDDGSVGGRHEDGRMGGRLGKFYL